MKPLSSTPKRQLNFCARGSRICGPGYPARTALVTFSIVVSFVAAVYGGTIVGSKHDLSTTGVDPYSDRVCVFCHTPHSANTTLPIQAPLWNRYIDTTKTFTPYSSSTMDTTPESVTTTVSLLCMGCHDGTLGTATVNGFSGSDKHDLVNAPGPGGIPDTSSYPNCRNCHGAMYGDPAAVWQGTDLSDDHPIAMTYPTAAQDAMFRTPPDLSAGWPLVPLYSGRVECPTCHDVHDPTLTPFLRTTNDGSQLCLTCHIK